MPEYVSPRIRENMLFDGKVKKLRINELVSKSFPGKKHVRIQRGRGGDRWYGPLLPEKSQTYNNSAPDPLKKRNATKPALNVGPLAACTRNTI